MTTKYIFFTGGVVSSVGKGVTAAAIGRLLKERGFNVTAQKLDPYINVDPGTMSPYQHGEVYVLDDGAETDLVEIGGTVGDIESLPFLEALRQMRSDVGRENTIYIHVTWLPHIGATDELKTKPTQHSVAELRSIGIAPDMIVARSDYPVGVDLCDKIALFCDVEKKAVVPMVTNPILYEVPLVLEKAGVGDYLLKRAGLEARRQPDWPGWEAMVKKVGHTKPKIKVALVGKYVELHDAYMSVREALIHAGLELDVEVEILWVHSAELEKSRGWEDVKQAEGILVPGGFGSRGIEGKVLAAHYGGGDT